MIFTLDDLKNPEKHFAENSLAVVGNPIGHSLSPAMQNAALKKLGLEKTWTYYRFQIDIDDIGQALDLFYRRKFVGLNFTIPHKEVVKSFIKSTDELSNLCGACNTLVWKSNGWEGFNTDGYGIEKAIFNLSGRKFKDSNIVILGAGGAARGTSFYASIKKCKNLKIYNRSPEKIERLLLDLEGKDFFAEKISLKQIEELRGDFTLINATSLGLKEGDGAVLDFSKISKDSFFYDMVYRKNSETISVLEAKKFGIRAESGLSMLAWQGARALSYWTGADEEILGSYMENFLKDNL